MKIVPIFADTNIDPPLGLLSVVINEASEPRTEFFLLFNRLQDAQYLYNFFSTRRALLRMEKPPVSELVALQRVQNETLNFGVTLKKHFENGVDALADYLESRFKLLNDLEPPGKPLARVKSRGDTNKGWIRIYGIRISYGLYVITGGGIKLTEVYTIKEDEILIEEKRKIELVRDMLVACGMYEPEDYKELYIDLEDGN